MANRTGKIHATETTSTHPDFNGASVRVTQHGYPFGDPDAFMEVEFTEDWPSTFSQKGDRVSIRTRDFNPDDPT